MLLQLTKMVLHIKNMVCPRCIQAVENLLDNFQVPVEKVELGIVETKNAVPANRLKKIEAGLHELGFELLSDQKSKLIESIKNISIQQARQEEGDDHSRKNLSQTLNEELHLEYNYLSALFSESEGQTIEKFHIAQKIEFVKELLVYDELSIKEITYKLGYSSVAHLSSQFKKVTGLTPSYFKKIKEQKRHFLTDL